MKTFRYILAVPITLLIGFFAVAGFIAGFIFWGLGLGFTTVDDFLKWQFNTESEDR